MSLEIVYTDHAIEIAGISAALSAIFPALVIYHYDFMEDAPEGLDVSNSKHAFFNTSYDPEKLEFRFSVCLYGLSEEDSEKRALHIGKHLSDLLQIRVVVPFRKPDEPDDPYYDILFQNGTSLLVDDSDTNFGDGTENPVRIIGEYPLPELKFDDKGNCLSVES